MSHVSIKLESPCEFINVEEINPLISKCQIKVCYVGDEPNRNGSIITKEFCQDKLAPTLRGCPIVGYWSEEANDFEEHNKTVCFEDGEFKMTEDTRPYGFVDINAKIWFQKFMDDGEVEREYLMTEGYLWTGQYPECQRVVDKGNNQSMELDTKTLQGTWTKNDKGQPEFFIINEAIMSKLCILGEDFEPCFEGANITKVEFSFGENFTNQLYSMMNELKEFLSEGGNQVTETQIQETEVQEEFAAPVEETSEPVAQEDTDFKKNEEDKDKEDKEDTAENEEDMNEEEDEDEKKKKTAENACASDGDEKKKKKNYVLEEVEEYSALQAQYAELQSQFEALQAVNAELTQFKAQVEKAEKEQMIARFYMLSDEDKADVVANIDNYSLDDIEAKLSIICVRNKVNFNLDTDNDENEVITFSLTAETDTTPAWIRAVQEVENLK